jgi:hypothetical protein
MCTIYKIVKNEHNFNELYCSRNNSILDWCSYYKFILYLSHKCKCKEKFNRDEWL